MALNDRSLWSRLSAADSAKAVPQTAGFNALEIHPVPPHAFEADVLALDGPGDFVVHPTADQISEPLDEIPLERHVALHNPHLQILGSAFVVSLCSCRLELWRPDAQFGK